MEKILLIKYGAEERHRAKVSFTVFAQAYSEIF